MKKEKRKDYPEAEHAELNLDITITHTVYTVAQRDLVFEFMKELAELKIKECPWLLKYEPFKSKAWRK